MIILRRRISWKIAILTLFSFGALLYLGLHETYAASVRLISPNGGEKWMLSVNHRIEWETEGDVGPLNLALYDEPSTDTLHQRFIIALRVAGVHSYTWRLPPTVLMRPYWVRIFTEDGSVSDFSGGPISIVDKVITVASPQGGEQYQEGDTVSVRWRSYRASSQLRLSLLREGEAVLEIGKVTNSGLYDWVIPAGITPSASYQLQLSDTLIPDLTGTSDALFTIGSPTPSPTPSPPPPSFSDGDLLRAEGDFRVWVVKRVGDHISRRHLFGPQLFRVYPHLRKRPIQVVPFSSLAPIPESALIRIAGSQRVYLLEDIIPGRGATARWISSPEAFRARGYGWEEVFTANPGEFRFYGKGEDI